MKIFFVGRLKTVERLIENGANVNESDWKDKTPLHEAVGGKTLHSFCHK